MMHECAHVFVVAAAVASGKAAENMPWADTHSSFRANLTECR